MVAARRVMRFESVDSTKWGWMANRRFMGDKSMRDPLAVRHEYKKVCGAMSDLAKRGGNSPLSQDEDLYLRLAAIKKTLEWVHPRLIKTTAKGHDRLNELVGHRHYAMGPTHDALYP